MTIASGALSRARGATLVGLVVEDPAWRGYYRDPALGPVLQRLITVYSDERLLEVHRCCRFIAGLLDAGGLNVRVFDGGPYSSLVAGFPGQEAAPVTLVGHFDVVKPEPDDSPAPFVG